MTATMSKVMKLFGCLPSTREIEENEIAAAAAATPTLSLCLANRPRLEVIVCDPRGWAAACFMKKIRRAFNREAEAMGMKHAIIWTLEIGLPGGMLNGLLELSHGVTTEECLISFDQMSCYLRIRT